MWQKDHPTRGFLDPGPILGLAFSSAKRGLNWTSVLKAVGHTFKKKNKNFLM